MWGAGDGSAVYYFLSETRRVYAFGAWLLQFPWLCYAMTVSTKYVAEWAAPLAMLLPSDVARTAAVLTLMGFNTGLSNCARLVYFQWQCNVALVTCLPQMFWTAVDAFLEWWGRRDATWKRSGSRMAGLLLLAEARARRVWMQLSRLAPWNHSSAEHSTAGAGLPSTSHRPLLAGRRPPAVAVDTLSRSLAKLWQGVAAMYIAVCLVGAAYTLTGTLSSKQPAWLRKLSSLTYLPVGQTWSMFAPGIPLAAQGWPLLLGVLDNGSLVDLHRWVQHPGSHAAGLVGPYRTARPTNAAFHERTVSRRWVMYLNYLEKPTNARRATLLSQYACRSWNTRGRGNREGAGELLAVQFVFAQQSAFPPEYGGPFWERSKPRYRKPKFLHGPAVVCPSEPQQPPAAGPKASLSPRSFTMCGQMTTPSRERPAATFHNSSLVVQPSGQMTGLIRRKGVDPPEVGVTGSWTASGEATLHGFELSWNGFLDHKTGRAVFANQYGNIIVLRPCPASGFL